MYTTEYSVKFTCPDANDFVDASGLLRYDSLGLHLEFQSKDAIFGVIKSDVKSRHILLSQIRDIKYKKSWFSHYLILQAKDMKTLRDVPGAASGEVRLKINKQDVAEAKSLASRLSLTLSEIRISRLVAESDADE
jgi:hypothetical protein